MWVDGWDVNLESLARARRGRALNTIWDLGCIHALCGRESRLEREDTSLGDLWS